MPIKLTNDNTPALGTSFSFKKKTLIKRKEFAYANSMRFKVVNKAGVILSYDYTTCQIIHKQHCYYTL